MRQIQVRAGLRPQPRQGRVTTPRTGPRQRALVENAPSGDFVRDPSTIMPPPDTCTDSYSAHHGSPSTKDTKGHVVTARFYGAPRGVCDLRRIADTVPRIGRHATWSSDRFRTWGALVRALRDLPRSDPSIVIGGGWRSGPNLAAPRRRNSPIRKSRTRRDSDHPMPTNPAGISDRRDRYIYGGQS